MDMISFGQIFVELVFGHVPGPPLPGEEIFTDEFAISCGGAVTGATAAARGGAHAGVCTVLGEDFGSRVVVEHCARHGVDLSPSARVRGRSAGTTVVLNFDGDRAFVTHVPPRPGEAGQVGLWREVLCRERPRWCSVYAGEDVPGLLRDAREAGTRTVVDMSLAGEWRQSTVIECVRLADVFVPNEIELRRLTGEDSTGAAVAAARGWGTPVVVKLGARGALVANRDSLTEVTDGVRPVEVRDLTGAGDAFAGAMIAALLRGVPLTGAVAAANAAGADAVERLGAVGEVDVTGIGSAAQALSEASASGAATGDAGADGEAAGRAATGRAATGRAVTGRTGGGGRTGPGGAGPAAPGRRGMGAGG